MTHIISICSGKGGVGKTLITSTLAQIISTYEEKSVLLIDMDFYVRGLTFLMCENLENLDFQGLSIYDYLLGEKTENNFKDISLNAINISDYINLIPSLTDKKKLVDWDSFAKLDFLKIYLKLKRLFSDIRDKGKVDYVIIDTRAGPDNISLATVCASDLSIIVQEQDEISMRATFNFRYQMMRMQDIHEIGPMPKDYLLYNKVSSRFARALIPSLEKSLSSLPPILFESDIFRSFNENPYEFISNNWKNTRLSYSLQKSWRIICGIFKEECKIEARPPSLPLPFLRLFRKPEFLLILMAIYLKISSIILKFLDIGKISKLNISLLDEVSTALLLGAIIYLLFKRL